jgi:hypothetical protein
VRGRRAQAQRDDADRRVVEQGAEASESDPLWPCRITPSNETGTR